MTNEAATPPACTLARPTSVGERGHKILARCGHPLSRTTLKCSSLMLKDPDSAHLISSCLVGTCTEAVPVLFPFTQSVPVIFSSSSLEAHYTFTSDYVKDYRKMLNKLKLHTMPRGSCSRVSSSSVPS